MSENLGACCPGRVCGGLAGMFLRFEALCRAGSLVIITFASGPSCVIEMLNRTIENNVGNMGGTIERLVELLFLDVSFAKLQMHCTFVGLDVVWTECFRGGCSGPASAFCFHVVREANIYDMKVQRAIHPAELCGISDVQCLPACSVCICRSWIHCTFIERPCQHAHPSDSLSRLCRRFRPIVVRSCCLELVRPVCQYGPARLTCI